MSKTYSNEISRLFDIASNLHSPTRFDDLMRLARLLINMERHGEGEEVLVVAKELAHSQSNPSRKISCLLLSGDCALSQGISSTAFLNYCRAYEIAALNNLTRLKLDCHLSLANYYQQKYEFELLIEECKKALDFMNSNGILCHELEFRVKLWRNSDFVDKENLFKLVELATNLQEFALCAEIKQSLAESLIGENHIQMAVRYLEEVHSWNIIRRDKLATKETELFIGRLLFESQDLIQAKYWLKRASRTSRVETLWPIEIEAEIFLRMTEQRLNPTTSSTRLNESIAKARALGLYEMLDQLSEVAEQ